MMQPKTSRRSILRAGAALGATIAVPSLVRAATPVLLGLDAELKFKSSTSAEAIKEGILLAMDEINERGVLGGRPLSLVERANNTIPARSIANLRELAGMPDMLAAFCGRFSPTVLESIPTIHEQKMILLNPWGAANEIVDNGYRPNFVFRLSLRDDWAVERMMEYVTSRRLRRIGLMMLNTSWGRSTEKSAMNYARRQGNAEIVDTQWINWDDSVESIGGKYQTLRARGAQAILLTANSVEAAWLGKALLALPPDQRLPIASHWGVAGGDLAGAVGPGFRDLDFTVVQTFAFTGTLTAKQKAVAAAHARKFGSASPRAIQSAVGVGHAYDLTHMIARAIEKAGSTDRGRVRTALENLGPYDGVVKRFERPFTASRHEALDLKDVFMARYAGEDMKLERLPAVQPRQVR